MLRPSRLALIWLACLFALGLVIGIAKALGFAVSILLDAIAWGTLLAFVLLATVDGLLTLRRPVPVVTRGLPGHLSIGRWGTVTLQVSCAEHSLWRGSIADHPPPELAAAPLSQPLALEPGETRQLEYRVKPSQRGHFLFEQCELLSASRFGLWGRRHTVPLAGATRVYPDFARLHGDHLLAVDNWLSRAGILQRQRRGSGMEFHQMREYQQGDSFRAIDWKNTARKGRPITREYQDERDQQILFWLDCGRNLRTQDDELSHFDHALNACMLLSHVALRQGDAVGLATFATEQARHIKPGKGPGQLNALLNATYDLHGSTRHADFEMAGAALLGQQKRRALVILITNLRDESSQALTQTAIRIGRRHRLLIVSLHEEVLDQLQAEPVETLEQALLYAQAVEETARRTALVERLKASGISILNTRPRTLAPALVGRYLELKHTAAF